jgi:hypothetical protein
VHQSFTGADLIAGNGAAVWLCMVLEMDIGIICGCLSGVKPVLAAVFPGLFGSSYRSRSGATHPTYGIQTGQAAHGEPFTFSGAPGEDFKLQSKKQEHAFSIEAISGGDDKGHRNLAWASSNGNMSESSDIPLNAIGVNQEVSVEEEEVEPTTPRSEGPYKMSDTGSEEWIMDDGPRECKA